MDLHLSGKVAIVTGASRGVGLAIVRALADEGARVIAGARNVAGDLTDLATEGLVHPVAVDLATPEGGPRLVAEALALHGGIDVVVNNVGGVVRRSEGFLSITDDDWTWGLNINLMAAVRTIRAAVPYLIERGGGSIVNVSSIMSYLPDPDVYDYTAGKAALSNFSKALSKEFGPRGIRVNTVSPGPTLTDMWLREDGIAPAVRKATGIDPDTFVKQISAQAASGRFTNPQEVADLVLLLASDRAANVVGANFAIDGGFVATL
ncbi:oxidoreductase [Micromonospora sp. SCSIO 07396]